MLEHKYKKWLGAENIALTDLLCYTLEVLSLLGYNTSFLTIYKCTIKNCGKWKLIANQSKFFTVSTLHKIYKYSIKNQSQ